MARNGNDRGIIAAAKTAVTDRMPHQRAAVTNDDFDLAPAPLRLIGSELMVAGAAQARYTLGFYDMPRLAGNNQAVICLQNLSALGRRDNRYSALDFNRKQPLKS